MGARKLQYLTDDEGETIGVFLSIQHYNELLEQIEELEDIRLFDEAKSDKNQEAIPFQEAIEEIEQQRNDL